MKILGLCNKSNDLAYELFCWLEDSGNEVIIMTDVLNPAWCKKQGFDLTVSYTYTHIIKQPVIDSLNGNVVNLHISYLPFNRGTYPNVWAIVDGTPRGVTLHYIDAGVDTGDIICQRIIPYDEDMTLYTSYMQLDKAAKDMFKGAFEYYFYWTNMRKKCIGEGTYHSDKEFYKLQSSFKDFEWNMKINDFKSQLKGRV